MDSTIIIVLVSLAVGAVACVALGAIAWNEYIYRINRQGEEDEPPSCSCLRLRKASRKCCRRCRARLRGGLERVGAEDVTGGKLQPPTARERPNFPSVDIMFIIKRLVSDKVIDQTHSSRLSGFVAKRDPRMVELVTRHTRSNPVLTRNIDFISALVILSKEDPAPPVVANEFDGKGDSFGPSKV